jgi:hypothetical protein
VRFARCSLGMRPAYLRRCVLEHKAGRNSAPTMSNSLSEKIGRRDVLRVFTAGAAVAAAGVASCAPSAPVPEEMAVPRARYQANSPEVQTFYRVNRYPGK